MVKRTIERREIITLRQNINRQGLKPSVSSTQFGRPPKPVRADVPPVVTRLASVGRPAVRFKRKPLASIPEIKQKNTPLGRAAIPARYARKKSVDNLRESHMAEIYLDSDVRIRHAVNIARMDLGLRPDRMAHPISTINDSRLKPVRKQAPRITQMEKGDTPFMRRVYKRLRKAGLI